MEGSVEIKYIQILPFILIQTYEFESDFINKGPSLSSRTDKFPMTLHVLLKMA